MIKGIKYGKFTGNYEDECPEVVIEDGRTVYPTPIFHYGVMFTPSKGMIDKYKGELYAVLVQEDNQFFFIGYTPLFGAYSDKGGFPNEGHIRTEKFIVRFDDKNEELRITQREGYKQEIVIEKNKVFVKSDKIYLTEENADKKAVLGDDMVDKLKDIITQITTAFDTITTALSSPHGVILTAFSTQLTLLSNQLDQTLSKKVKLK